MVLYSFLKLIAYLPWFLMDLLSAFLYFLVYKVIKYRVKVVKQNLVNAFPELSVKEINAIQGEFYKHLCDLLVETLKLYAISQKDLKQKVQIGEGFDEFKARIEHSKGVIVVLGHMGNWEMLGARFSLEFDALLKSVYFPIKSKGFSDFLLSIRKRFGAELYSSKELLRMMVKLKNEKKLTALIADQTPSYSDTYWTTFLNQDTPFFVGPEKLAKKFQQPVFYASCKKVKRHHYVVDFKEINFDEVVENDLTFKFAQLLEKDILAQKSLWLWSHRRWKKKKPSNLV